MDAPRRRHQSGSNAARPGSRSSRRILSGGMPVELGGGVGILGLLSDESNSPTTATPQYSYNLYANLPLASSAGSGSPTRQQPLTAASHNKAASSTSTASGSASSPTLSTSPVSPLPSFGTWSVGPSAPGVSVRRENASNTGTVSSVASTSSSTSTSRRLPLAPGGNTTRRAEDAGSDDSADKVRADPPKPLPAMAQGALPAPPSLWTTSGSDSSSLKASKKGKIRNAPAPIRTDHNNAGPSDGRTGGRFHDFDHIVGNFEPRRHAPAPPTQANGRDPPKKSTLRIDTSDASQQSSGPHYHHQRSVTEPSQPPTSKQPMDYLRSMPERRTASGMSEGRRTPISENAARRADADDNPRQRNVTAPTQPTIKPRKSSDLLRRPSAELLGMFRPDAERASREREAKEAKAAAQRALGVDSDNRKGPAITLKKSSGALRNLFRSKPKEPPPETPNLPRTSFALGDLVRPKPNISSGNTTPISVSAPFQPEGHGRLSLHERQAPSITSSSGDSASRGKKKSTASDRDLPPLPASDSGSAFKASGNMKKPSSPILSKLSPKLPSPKALRRGAPPSPTESKGVRLPPVPGATLSPHSRKPVGGLSVPLDDPLRYSKLPPRGTSKDNVADSAKKATSPVGSDTGSTSTVRQFAEEEDRSSFDSLAEGAQEWKPALKSSSSLHLLQLPELDLALDFSFDGFGSTSTSSPESSPHGSQPGTPGSRSRSASGTLLTSPASKAVRTERRRSKSFDAAANGGEDMWRSLDFDKSWNNNKLFTATPSSVSAPKLTTTAASPDVNATSRGATNSGLSANSSGTTGTSTSRDTDSLSTHGSFDHSRTPSGGSSTNETSSPSPPRTPEDAHSAFLASGVDGKAPRTSLDPPIALEVPEQTIGKSLLAYDRPYSIGSSTTPSSSSPVTPTKTDLRTPKAEMAPVVSPSEAPTPKAETPTPTPTPSTSAPMLVEKALPKLEQRVPVSAPAPKKSGARLIHDNPARPPRELEEPKEPEQIPPSKAPFRCRPTHRTLLADAKPVMPDPNVSIRDLTQDLIRALDNVRYPTQSGSGPERSGIIRNRLLVLVQEVDRRCYSPHEEAAYRDLREVCFDWADSLLFELRVEQPANERGACLEGLAAVLESQCLAAHALEASPSHQDAFLHLMMRVMNFVMDKLGAKGVFHNTLLFSGRFLAFAFFRIPHVGGQLVGVLQPPRGALMRFTRPVLLGRKVPPEAQPSYPAHLEGLCFDDSQSYTRRLLTLDPDFDSAAEKEAFHFQPGNWLRRWQSDDSELFPAFYRAYHKQLAFYLAPAILYYQQQRRPIPASVLLRAPGYAHLATIFSIKCHSYILGSVNAVTTSSSTQHFDATESAGFRGSQKPAVLETANRRLVETLWMFASAPINVPTHENVVVQCEGSQLWGEMVDLWTKNLITKTSLYAPKGVFCLFDLLDGLVDPIQWGDVHSPLDVPYLIGLFRLILNEGEHALTLVKVIAFLFTHWEILTARPEDRRELCMDILLNKKLFERLLLFWSQSVRSYVLRLVVFRLGHLHTTKDEPASYEVEIQSVRLLQQRLDRIKKRYDELEPQQSPEILDSASLPPRTPTTPGLPRSRSTITMVTDSPQATTRAERLLAKEEDDSKSKGSWWKRTLGMQKKPKVVRSPRLSTASTGSNGSGSPHTTSNPSLPAPKNNPAVPGVRKVDNGATSPWSTLGPSLMPPEIGTGGSGSPTSPTSPSNPIARGTARKSPPPNISTEGGPKPHVRAIQDAKAQFAFEFELPTASPLSDTFEASNATSPRRNSQPPSPRGATSPHMSHSFSKRSSLLPPSTEKALEAYGHSTPKVAPRDRDPGYPLRLHAYAIRMLAELEDAQKEYDEWWSEGGIGKVDGAPPRLAVAWPFHEGED
ncbi:hypothetical protein CspHIS471_0704030 [Cutaneotrichosporon sp. HIS471]|nr:hypothetical protein CspHIS471_0704030 [Cutaneotrichosporon sp. HIS471]